MPPRDGFGAPATSAGVTTVAASARPLTALPTTGLAPAPQPARAPGPAPIPDLLNADPIASLDPAQVIPELLTAFGTGDGNRDLNRLHDGARICATTWGGSSFRRGLYIDVLLSHCMPVRIGELQPTLNRERLVRLLENPPADPRTRETRRAVLSELAADPTARRAFERIYRRLYDLRIQLQGIDNVGYWDSRTRRFTVLSSIREIIEDLRTAFAHAKSELTRLTAYATHVAATPEYRYLRDLVQYENRLSDVQFRMRIGSDGRMRKFEIVQIRENRANPFYRAPLRRLFSKFTLWFRGYQIGASGLLDEWLEEVFRRISPHLPALFELLVDQEFFLAALAFREQCEAWDLAVSFPEVVDSDTPADQLFMRGLFNPLLFTQRVRPVPSEIVGSALGTKTILTGPNSGGKTRLLQALGLVQILGECGMWAPVAEARIARANGLFVSLIEEGSVDQAEGRLGKELLRIRTLFESARVGVLVILDELCSGTNPSEGEEIFRLVLSLLDGLDARAVIATHFLDFARRLASEARDDSNLRLEFLQVHARPDHQPTYQFCPGVAHTSMARQIAERLGVTDSILRALVANRRLDAGMPTA